MKIYYRIESKIFWHFCYVPCLWFRRSTIELKGSLLAKWYPPTGEPGRSTIELKEEWYLPHGVLNTSEEGRSTIELKEYQSSQNRNVIFFMLKIYYRIERGSKGFPHVAPKWEKKIYYRIESKCPVAIWSTHNLWHEDLL